MKKRNHLLHSFFSVILITAFLLSFTAIHIYGAVLLTPITFEGLTEGTKYFTSGVYHEKFQVHSGTGHDGYLYGEVVQDTPQNKVMALKTKKYVPSTITAGYFGYTRDCEADIGSARQFSIEFDLNIKDNLTLRQFQIWRRNAAGTSAAANMIVTLNTDNSIKIGTNTIGSYTVGAWHNFKMVCDLDTKEAHLFLDNQKITTDAVHLVIPDIAVTLTTFFFQQYKNIIATDDGTFYEMHLDHFKIESMEAGVLTAPELSSPEKKGLNPRFQLNFGNDLEAGWQDCITFQKAGESNTEGYSLESVDGSSKNFLFIPDQKLSVDTEYEVRIHQAKDIYGNFYEEQFSFFTVEEDLTEQVTEAVEAALSHIPLWVTQNISLPAQGIHDVVFTWETDKSAILNLDGNVNRPQIGAEDTAVTLTLTGTKQTAQYTSSVTTTVPRLNITSGAAVQSTLSDASFLTDDNPTTAWTIPSQTATGSFSLTFAKKVDISFCEMFLQAPANTTYQLVNADTGKTIKEGAFGEAVNGSVRIDFDAVSLNSLRVVLNKSADSACSLFSFFLFINEQAKIDLDAEALILSNTANVTGDLPLPVNGKRGTAISWASSNPSVIATDGTVIRPPSTTTVVLTATVSLSTAPDTQPKERTFSVTVSAKATERTGGGGSASSSGSFSATITPLAPIAPIDVPAEESILFADVEQSHWAYSYIDTLAKQNILNGMDKERFAPEQNVTREEFIKMLTGVLDLNETAETLPFSDVEKGAWYYDSIAAAYQLDIVQGFDGLFGTGMPISRQDMAVMLSRALEKTGNALPKVREEVVFADWNDVADYAKPALTAMQQSGIISGYPDASVRPAGYLTRAEAAKIIYMIFIGL